MRRPFSLAHALSIFMAKKINLQSRRMKIDSGIRGNKLKQMLRLIHDNMEDYDIYDDPVFSLLYFVLLKITTVNSDVHASPS